MSKPLSQIAPLLYYITNCIFPSNCIYLYQHSFENYIKEYLLTQKEVFMSSANNHDTTANTRAIPVAAHYFREPGSAITHLVAANLTLIGSMPMLLRAQKTGNSQTILSIGIFLASMFCLYLSSTLYHSWLGSEHQILLLKKLDHIMISVLIAGTYTPVCMITLHQQKGTLLLALIWGLAVLGILLKAFWVTCPRWISSCVYLIMGWLCVLVFPQLLHLLPLQDFLLLFMGGLCYTAGAIIYALKLSAFNARHPYFGSHEIFHLFVMGGSFLHYLFVMRLL
jgi:hemolysin III